MAKSRLKRFLVVFLFPVVILGVGYAILYFLNKFLGLEGAVVLLALFVWGIFAYVFSE